MSLMTNLPKHPFRFESRRSPVLSTQGHRRHQPAARFAGRPARPQRRRQRRRRRSRGRGDPRRGRTNVDRHRRRLLCAVLQLGGPVSLRTQRQRPLSGGARPRCRRTLWRLGAPGSACGDRARLDHGLARHGHTLRPDAAGRCAPTGDRARRAGLRDDAGDRSRLGFPGRPPGEERAGRTGSCCSAATRPAPARSGPTSTSPG